MAAKHSKTLRLSISLSFGVAFDFSFLLLESFKSWSIFLVKGLGKLQNGKTVDDQSNV